jgi:site-specific recombinase XerD
MGLRDRELKAPEERWEDVLNKLAEKTSTGYRREFDEFLKWAQEDYDGLIEYWLEIRDDPFKRQNLSDAVEDYVQKLYEEGYTGGKQSVALKAIRKFFKSNGFHPQLNVKIEFLGDGIRVAKKGEILDLLAYAINNPRDQAIIAVSKDSGLRCSDITRMKIKHIQAIIDNPEKEFHIFELPVHKTRNLKRIALPTLGKDAIRYIRKWLKTREEIGLDNNNPENYLFVNIREHSKHERDDRENTISASVFGERMSASRASTSIQAYAKKAGYDISANSLRKYQTTRLTVSGIGQDIIKVIQGKHQNSSLDSYIQAQKEEILPIYIEHYDQLLLDENIPLHEFKDLSESVKTQKNEIEALKKDRLELWQALEKTLKKIPLNQDTDTNFRQALNEMGVNHKQSAFTETDDAKWFIHPEEGLCRLNKVKSFDNAEQYWIDKNGNHYVAEFKKGLDYHRVQEILRTTKPIEVYLKHPEFFKNVEKLEK